MERLLSRNSPLNPQILDTTSQAVSLNQLICGAGFTVTHNRYHGPIASQEHHRDLSGGKARATIFGVSDGLVSNISLILGVAGADVAPGVVRLAGLAGLLAGAVSMAAGEYISVKAQNELIERELAIEKQALADDPIEETEELAQLYISRGLRPETAKEVAEQLMANPAVALEVHAREELGVDPDDLGDPVGAATSSFGAFCVGAVVPLFPWFVTEGGSAVLASIVLGLSTAALVGVLLAQFTGRSLTFSAARQTLIAAAAAALTFLIGSQVGTGL